jgi:putative toxin-antitoxin system antitoxin component (TIGR02293 family)
MAYNKSPKDVLQAQTVANILGGRKVLSKRINNSNDLKTLTRKGLPAGSVVALAGKLRVGNGAISRTLHIPQRTLTRRMSEGSRLTPAESDRTVRMARVFAHAIEMIGDEEKAVAWLSTPNRAFGGEKPLDQLDTDTGARAVEDILGRIAYGVYS